MRKFGILSLVVALAIAFLISTIEQKTVKADGLYIVSYQVYDCDYIYFNGVQVSTTCPTHEDIVAAGWDNCAAMGQFSGTLDENGNLLTGTDHWHATCVKYGQPPATQEPEVSPTPESTEIPGSEATAEPTAESTAVKTTKVVTPLFVAPQKPENMITDISSFHATDKQWIENWIGGNGHLHSDGVTPYTKVLVVVQIGGDLWYFPEGEYGFVREHESYLQASDGTYHSR